MSCDSGPAMSASSLLWASPTTGRRRQTRRRSFSSPACSRSTANIQEARFPRSPASIQLNWSRSKAAPRRAEQLRPPSRLSWPNRRLPRLASRPHRRRHHLPWLLDSLSLGIWLPLRHHPFNLRRVKILAIATMGCHRHPEMEPGHHRLIAMEKPRLHLLRRNSHHRHHNKNIGHFQFRVLRS